MKHNIKWLALTVLLIVVVSITGLASGITIDSHGFLSISSNMVIAAEIDEPLPDTGINQRIYYTDDQGNNQYIDNSWEAVPLPWNWKMSHADYTVQVKEEVTDGQVLEFSRAGETVYLQPKNLQWINDLGQIQLISSPSSVSCTVGTEPTQLVPGVINNEGYVQWNDAYGTGINYRWQCTPGVLEKYLEIESLDNLPTPAAYIISGGNPRLELNLRFAPSKNLVIYNGDTVWDQKTKVQTFDLIRFVKDGEELWHFQPLQYWCSDGGILDGESVATLSKSGNQLYISIQVPYSWLQSAIYPIYIDADIAIETSGFTNLDRIAIRGGIFWKSTTVGYVVFVDSANDLKYRKTADGGAIWNSTNIRTGTIRAYDCWADWQTAGDAGTKIHIAYMDDDTNDIRYVYLETATDTVGGDDQIVACGGTGELDPLTYYWRFLVSITKTRGGNIAVVFKYDDSDATPFSGFYTSPDGDTWTSKTSPVESSNHYILLFAGNEADNQDLYGAYWDTSANEITLKTFDNSGDSWGESAALATMIESSSYLQMDGQIRLSDGHLIFAAFNLWDDASADLMVWDINGAGSITQKTNVITDEDETFAVSVFINQVNDDIYVSYLSGTNAQSLVKCFYQKSVDGGANWGGETAMQVDAEDDERWVSAGCMKAAWGGKFEPVWFNDDLNDIFCNVTNAITINASAGYDISNTPDNKAFGVVACSGTYYAKGSPPSNPVEDGDCTFTITNNGASACDLDMKVSDFTGGVGWNIGAPAENQCRITAYYSGQNPASGLVLTNDDQEFYDGLAGSATIKWDFKFETPTSVTDGVAKEAILTITAVAED